MGRMSTLGGMLRAVPRRAAERTPRRAASGAGNLEREPGAIRRPRRFALSAPHLQFVHERRQFRDGDVETVANLLDPAAASWRVADRPALIDRRRHINV